MSQLPAGPTGLEELSPRARDLLEKGSELRPWPEAGEARAWARIRARVESKPERPWRALLAAGAVLGLVSIAGTAAVAWRAQAGRIRIEGMGTVALAGDARFTLQGDVLTLEKGVITAHIDRHPPGRTLVVITPTLRIRDVGTIFSVEVENGLSRVRVEAGEVEVEAPQGSLIVKAGEEARSDDPRFQLVPPGPMREARVRAVAECPEQAPIAERRACLERQLQGSGLGAQNASYALAQLELQLDPRSTRAVELWRSYQQRFPDGVFAPEVGFQLVEQLATEGQLEGALQEADAVLARFPAEPGSGRVSLIRANLLCEAFQRPAEARAVYGELAESGAEPALREEASFRLGLSDLRMHRAAEARTELQAYLAQFPTGAHRAEAESLAASLAAHNR